MSDNQLNIAVLLTCYNRREKTCACLDKLFLSVEEYNKSAEKNNLKLTVFLVDDGCTDGTADAVVKLFSEHDIRIIKGDGNLFWAGGMRLAWSEAYRYHADWNFYLLLNDDTDVFSNTFIELFNTHYYCLSTYNKEGIYSGITCAKNNHTIMTYGGDVWINRLTGKTKRLLPGNKPQMCDMTNANILLVSSKVVDKVGMLSEDYKHGMADYDYAIRARKAGIPVLITANFCGACDNDHTPLEETARRIVNMTLKERKKYFDHPIHSNKDYIRYIYNTSPMRLPIVYVGRFLNLYFPKFYYRINKIR